MVPRMFELCLGPVNTLTVEGCSETKPFGHLSSHNFRNFETHLFFQNTQTLMYISETQRNIQKKILVFEVIGFGFVSGNSPYCNENACYRQLMC